MLLHALPRAGNRSRAAAVSIELFGGAAVEEDEHVAAAQDGDAHPITTEEWQSRFVRNHVRHLAEQV